jgi:GT2 family glycosyltransferase
LNALPSVSVVILNWNGKSFLEKFLPSVLASTYENLRLIVADNASTDDSVSFLKDRYPQVEIFSTGSNEGYSVGYNKALRHFEADYFVLLNSDVEVTPAWINPVIEIMEADHQIAACQPKILAYDNRSQFEYAGACGGFIDFLGYPFTRGRIFDTCEEDKGQYDDTMQIFWASGAALFVRASVFDELNGFNEIFFAHQEEIDLCWRMHQKGYKIFAVPSSVVYHVGGGTLPMGNSKKVYLNFRNNLIMLKNNLTFTECIWKIPVRILLDIIAAWRGLLTGNRIIYGAIWKAHLHFVAWLFKRKKGSTLHHLSMDKMDSVYHRSVVWQYFIKHKRTFSEIIPAKK